MGLRSRKNRGRSAEPRATNVNVPEFVNAAPPRDAASMERYGYGHTSETDDETMSLRSAGSATRRFKKMFKKKRKKKKNADGGGASVSSASALAKQAWSPFRNSISQEFGEDSYRKKRNSQDRFRVMPDDAYPNTYLNREEMRQEMNQKSAYYHDLRVPYQKGKEIGQLRLEVLQCFGLPSVSMTREVSAYAIAVCGSHAFKTDILPPATNPMWLSQMRRACMFPIDKAYDKIYLGVFDSKAEGNTSTTSDFMGRIVIDVARLRAGTTYDISLPLRQSAHVFSRNRQGAVRVRMHLIWVSERSAVLSYLPKKKPKFVPDESHKINCLDERSFRNVAQLVHGRHMPGKFSMTLLKSTMREMTFTRIHIFRYIRRREIYNLRFWVYPAISAFVFCAWMHSVWANTFRYLPGHILTYFLLLLYVNYAYYSMDSPIQNGFSAPSIEELFNALVYGTKGRRKKYIEALNMESDSHVVDPEDCIEFDLGNGQLANQTERKLPEIAKEMREGMKVHDYKYRLKTYKNTFMGTAAVDFLTRHRYAYSRSDAVILGRRLAKELKLFESVGQKDEQLKDEPLFYHFVDHDISNKNNVIKGPRPKYKKIFRSLGLVNHDINSDRDHVEFPFANGKSHPRFTVKQALVMASSHSKKKAKEREEAREIVDCAEFGVAPAFHMEEEVAEVPQSLRPGELVKTGIRRGSLVASATLNAATNLPQNIMNLPQNITNVTMNRRRTMEFGDPDELYGLLKERHNPSLDELMESRKLNDSIVDQHAYDSDDDVETVLKRRKKGSVIEEKFLFKPPGQEISRHAATSGPPDRAFAKSLMEMRHKTHGVVGHLFNDRVYKIDQALFPIKNPEENNDAGSVATKRGLFGRNKASQDSGDDEDKKNFRTPYDARVDECDKILQIHKYSHSNPWINRVAVILQPMIEMVQVGLFASRAGYNVMTWQDPILSFWIAIIGPVLVLMFHLMPYRILFGALGIFLFGPQNWLYRLFQESKPGYKPPSFDKIVKSKSINKNEPYSEIQLFSSMAPGNQHIKFKNVDPQQVKQVVVPNGVLKYSRFYDWPPEPEYARVYKSPPPRNMNVKTRSAQSFEIASHDSGHYTTDSEAEEEEAQGEDKQSYWYDATLARTKKKKKKKGLQKVTHNVKKGAGVVVGTTVEAGGALTGAVVGVTGAVVGTTLGATIGVAKATGKVTKMAAKGTANVGAAVVDGAINAGNQIGQGLRKSNTLNRGLDHKDFEYDEEYNDYYGE
mmetsp:Transcript_21832/g.53992  ORF Transcript_21832/g.53992 Transcript_21832/m.53992 type:complete len:1245 (-) Transcript_21832:1200-4934(-)|eukprot:CAMPEP_0113644122 /NCGR_PEP_ID=MMETSP0017_2-20120614/23214_1 /TAXON_ID=2856 /ORGANISM="Cylindrotheca closterium" /LENGTH=1244 /DNA_ID=CAMNT_0000555701 /DNA_START=149 /DNA_END=3883 /DNA_ORIENTATION=+ /assembly_acc=CAM_ASM_000147